MSTWHDESDGGIQRSRRPTRHCDPKLTANIYSRFGFDEDRRAILRTPDLAALVEAPEGEEVAA